MTRYPLTSSVATSRGPLVLCTATRLKTIIDSACRLPSSSIFSPPSHNPFRAHPTEMDEVRAPEQVVLKRPRDIYGDQQRQSEIRPFSYPSQLRLRGWRRRDNTDLLWMSRLLAFFNPEMPKPNSLSLPFFNTQLNTLYQRKILR